MRWLTNFMTNDNNCKWYKQNIRKKWKSVVLTKYSTFRHISNVADYESYNIAYTWNGAESELKSYGRQLFYWLCAMTSHFDLVLFSHLDVSIKDF